MVTYDTDLLYELAENDLSRAHVSAAGGATGVALPDWVQPGAILSTDRARRLAAQLLLESDLHDAIADSATSRNPF